MADLRAYLALAASALLASCGPMPVARAEALCQDEADLAAKPRGEITMGVGSGGSHSSISLEISSDYLRGRSPEAVYNACVQNRAGVAPSRPYRGGAHG